MSDSPDKPTDETPVDKLLDYAFEQAEHADQAGTHTRSADVPAHIFPGYKILGKVHRGGQGTVYKAIQESTGKTVAIKVLHAGALAGAGSKARFQREVAVLAKLNHPHIVAVQDSGSVEDVHYFVMEYVEGEHLDVYAEHSGSDQRALLRLFATICDAVNAAHLRGVIHRDLKPSNIRVGSDGRPRIVDFGLAKEEADDSESQQVTVTGQFVGSLPWASPEQASGTGNAVDVRTDVYALGVILYQLLTGRFPYEVVGNMRDVLDNILRAIPAPPSTVSRRVDDEIETIVLKCLQKEPERRYQNAGELGRDLHRYLAGEPIEAKRDSSWYVLKKLVGRHRVIVSSAVLVLVLTGFYTVLASWFWYRAEAQESRAEVIFQILEKIAFLPGAKSDDARADEAEQAIAELLSSSPWQDEDRIRLVLGAVLFGMNRVDHGEQEFERVLELRRTHLGQSDPDVLGVMLRLARMLRGAGRLSKSEQRYRVLLSAIPQ